MSVRIYDLAKRVGLENKDLLALLKERGFDVKTASSAIDTISAEALEKEIIAKAPPAAPVAQEPAPVASPPPAPAAPKLPPGVFVRSLDEINREKAEIEKAKQAARVVSQPPGMPAMRAPVSYAPPPPPPRVVAPSIPSAPPPMRPPSAPQIPVPVAQPRPLTPPTTPPVKPAATPPPTNAPASPVAAVAPSAPTAPAPVNTGELRVIHIKPPIIVRDFAVQLGVKPFRLISELMEMGIFGAMNQALDEPVALKLAEKHGCVLEIKHRGDAAPVGTKEKPKPVEVDEAAQLQPRPPVVCILGHVDHGKTTLLDTIRKANVAAGEAGGITQHIGAYQIEHNGRKITFLDTPGHAAFNKMRARGANVTDIAILVIAADDAFMPQTDEALKYAKNAKAQNPDKFGIIVAMTKADVKGANFDRVKMQMQERGIASEDWGGETVAVKVAALKGEGITDLLEYIILQADVLELKANPKAPAEGSIIEAEVEVGRGHTATVIVQRGTLRVGDAVVCGAACTKIKALFDDRGQQVKEAPPSMPVKIIGWSNPPEAGGRFRVVKSEKEAKVIAEEAEHLLRKQQVTTAATPKDTSIDALFKNIADSQKRTLKVVIKCDVFGSVEAVRTLLEGIKSDKVDLEIIAADVGQVSKNDVLMASTSRAMVIGFNTRSENGVSPLAKHHNVVIQHYSIIYELADKVKEAMADLLDPDLKEVKLGVAEVRATFPVAKGFVAGCLVTEGKVTRNAQARVRRGKEVLHTSHVSTLRRFKDDANEVRAGLECGVRLEDFDGYQPGDTIECFEIQKIRASL